MDLEKLNYIKSDILKEEWIKRPYSEAFCGLYVDGTGKLTFDLANASFHAFKVYSKYDYPVYLFVAINNNPTEIEKIVQKYPNTKVYSIPQLKTPLEYNEWMLHHPWFLISPKFERIFSFQEDGALISKGWENYFIKGNWDYVGSPWRSDITVLSKNGPLKTLRVGNGGISLRKRSSIIKVVDYIHKNGGQHQFFTGIKINDELKQSNSWLNEDAMICSVGATFDLLKLPTLEEARKFGHEPIELSLYMDKNNIDRPYCFHKVDF